MIDIWLDENSARTLEELAETLNVDNVSNCLHTMTKIQKEGNVLLELYELYELAIQNRLIICTSLLSRHKKAVFVSIITIIVMKKMDLL